MLDSIRLYYATDRYGTEMLADLAIATLNAQGHDCGWTDSYRIKCRTCEIRYHRWGIIGVLRREAKRCGKSIRPIGPMPIKN